MADTLQESGQQAAGPSQQSASTSTEAANPPAVVDIQAQIDAALTKQKTDFESQLEKATGHKDLKAFTDAQLKAQGKLQELADSNKQEAQTFKTKFEQMSIGHALLSASVEAVDPAVIESLLAARCLCDADGKVTIDGKPVGDAVKALLADKPFLAKAQGGTGSGAASAPSSGQKNPWSKTHFNLTEQITLQTANPALAAQLKAAAQS